MSKGMELPECWRMKPQGTPPCFSEWAILGLAAAAAKGLGSQPHGWGAGIFFFFFNHEKLLDSLSLSLFFPVSVEVIICYFCPLF